MKDVQLAYNYLIKGITYGVTYMENKDHANKSSANVRMGGNEFKDAPENKNKMTR